VQRSGAGPQLQVACQTALCLTSLWHPPAVKGAGQQQPLALPPPPPPSAPPPRTCTCTHLHEAEAHWQRHHAVVEALALAVVPARVERLLRPHRLQEQPEVLLLSGELEGARRGLSLLAAAGHSTGGRWGRQGASATAPARWERRDQEAGRSRSGCCCCCCCCWGWASARHSSAKQQQAGSFHSDVQAAAAQPPAARA
jgi:hypothetical protein